MKELIKQVLAGQQEAFRQIVRDLSPSLRSYLAGRLSDFHIIEDLSQEIFVAVYQSLSRYDDKYDFRTWFFTIARNKLNSHLRKMYSPKNLKFAYEEEILNLLAQVENINENKADQIGKVKHCINKLPDDALELIKSRYYINETVISLAERLESTENAISSKLFRIRKQLKTCIDQETSYE